MNQRRPDLITLSLGPETIDCLRAEAALRETSMSGLVRQWAKILTMPKKKVGSQR